MNNEKRLKKTLQILSNRLTKHEYEEVSILLNILWGGVSFGYELVARGLLFLARLMLFPIWGG